MNTGVGTRSWALATNGDLRPRDRYRLVAQAMLTRIARLPRRTRAWLGLRETTLAKIDPAALRLPDSAAAVRAQQLLESLAEPWLQNHSLRTYLWGAMLAQSDRLRFDEELLFVASALHDLGLSDSHRCTSSCATCFAITGAHEAEKLARSIGWTDERRELLYEAISLHLNVRVGLADGAEAHLLHAGAGLDLIGARLHEIDHTASQSVLEQYPRLGFKREIVAALEAQASNRPQSRAAFLVGLGLSRMIQVARWRE